MIKIQMIKIDKPAWDAMVAHAESKFPNECCGAMIGKIDGDEKHVTAAVPLENAYAGAQGARYELRPEDLLAADRKRARRGARSDRHLPFASRLRRVFFEDRSRELLPLVFVRRTIGEGRKVRSRGQFPAERRSNRRRERRIDMAKVLIPTPLRQYADKHDSVELDRRDRRRSAGRADRPVSRSAQAAFQRRRQAAQLRQRVPERRRHPLSEKRRDPGGRRRHALDRPEHRRRCDRRRRRRP